MQNGEEILLARFRDHIRSTGALLPAQEEAVFSSSPLTLVGAGAGTGKTHTLSWRFLRALLRQGTRPRDILTLTFTDKAAGEMRDRITGLFASLRPVLDPHGDLLEEAAETLDEAPISTIHAFAFNLIREEALSLPSGPSVRPAAPPEEELFRRRASDALDALDVSWFDRNLPPGKSSGDFLGGMEDSLSDILNEYSPGEVSRFALDLAAILECRGESPESLRRSADDEEFFLPVAERIRSVCLPESSRLMSIWLEEVLPRLPGELPGTGGFRERLAAFRNEWLSRRNLPLEGEISLHFAGDLRRRLLGNLSGASGSRAGGMVQDALGVSLVEHRDRFAALWKGLSFLQAGISPADARLRKVLLRVASLLWEASREFRRRRGIISYDDMVRLAGEATSLRQDGGNMRTFSEILVDEFQDTNPVQDRLIRAVLGKGGRMFLVGDLKQSIYRFRHADPSLFGGLLSGSARDGGPSGESRYVPLSTSFRTRPSLLGEINTIFRRTWEAGISSSLPQGYEPLLFPDAPGLEEEREDTDIPPLIPVILTARKGEPLAETRARVAAALAERLSALRGRLVWDKKERRMRPAAWRDMAILVPSRTSFPPLEETLTPKYGIPAVFERGKRYFARGEIADFSAAIRAMAFPGDRVALLSFLSSPFSGFSPDQIPLLLDPSSPPLGEAFPLAAENLESWRTVGRIAGMGRAASLLLGDQSFLLRSPGWYRKGAMANLCRAMDLLDQHEAVFGNDPAGAAAWFGSMESGLGSVEEASPLGEEEDVVRVMTIHGAKGLEFPIVAVMDIDKPAGSGNGKGQSLVPSTLLGAGASRWPLGWASQGAADGTGGPTTGRLASFLEKSEAEEEWERLFYVACTRAMDCLLLCSPCGEKDGIPAPRPGSWLSLLDFRGTESEDGGEPWHGKTSQARLSPGDPPPDTGEDRTIPAPSGEGLSLERMSATSFALFSWCPAAWRMKFRQGVDLAWELPSTGEEGGADLGSLAHWILSRWNFCSPALERFLGENPPPGLPPLLRPVWRDEGGKRALAEWLSRFAELPSGKELADLASRQALRREVPFRIPMAEGPELSGAMDVFWKGEKGICIRDYKITASGGEEGHAGFPSLLYECQLLFYGFAASLAFPGSEVDVRLIFLREGRAGNPVRPSRSWEVTGHAIRSAARVAATGPFPPSAERCPLCPFLGDCPYGTRSRGSSSF